MEKRCINEKFSRDQCTGNRVKNIACSNCDFSGVDLTDSEFVDCSVYDRNSLEGCV
ncbi:UNVERIFIED_CONTAM: QnrD family quinolone resistance pentapeptide repeat protein, partial [Salmonella enterica subsp. enterica serovar Weltevreden]